MSEEHRRMWTDLGLDREKHDRLLEALGSMYKDIYMRQENRPETMKYFDFVISEAHGLRIKELLDRKKEGGKVFGTFCVYVPEEIIFALDSICVGLCAGTSFSIPDAETVLPSSLCPLVKSAFGFKVGKICPYFEASDILVGETTCDAKKKVWEIQKKYQATYVMEVPNCKSDAGRDLWRKEVGKFAQMAEKLTGKTLTTERLTDGIEKVDKKRQALQRLNSLRFHNPSVISGKDALLVNQIAFYDDVERLTAKVNELCDELDERARKGVGVFPAETPRILVSGSPLALPNWKLHHVVETSGAVVVSEESCVGTRYFSDRVERSGGTVEAMLDDIADRHLKINCACFTPNDARVDQIIDLFEKSGARGVIHNSLVFCHPYIVESVLVREKLQEKNIPVLTLENDYGDADIDQLKTRFQAFIEMIA